MYVPWGKGGGVVWFSVGHNGIARTNYGKNLVAWNVDRTFA